MTSGPLQAALHLSPHEQGACQKNKTIIMEVYLNSKWMNKLDIIKINK